MRAEWNKALSWLSWYREDTYIVFFIGDDGRSATKHWLLTDIRELLDYLRIHNKVFLALIPYKQALQVRKDVCGKALSYSEYFKKVSKCLVCNNENLTLNNNYGILMCPNCRRFFLSATLNKEMD